MPRRARRSLPLARITRADYKNTGAALNNFRLTRQCWKKLSWDQALALADLGHKNLDRMVSDDGKNKACESIDKLQASTPE
jgi:hypothetical protein